MTETVHAPVASLTTVKDDLITALLSFWLIAGVLVDGWAHVTRGGVESFFTPWHALFYSGFLAVSGWTLYLTRRSSLGPPVGYRLGISGVAVFAAGGVGDLLWHQFLGIETSIDALVSPTHLLLLLGAVLIISSPIRASWERPTPRQSPWSWLAPTVFATSLIGVLAQFFFLYASGWGGPAFASEWNPGDSFGVALGMLSLVVTTLIITTLGLLLLRRWDPPFGTFTVLVGAIGLAMEVVHGFEQPGNVLAAIAGGMAVDWLRRQLRPGPERPVMLRAFSFLAPMAIWSVEVLYLSLAGNLRWPIVLWLGAILMMGLWGLGLSVVAAPPQLPGNPASS